VLHRVRYPARLHLALSRLAPVAQAADALHVQAARSSALRLIRSFAPDQWLLRPLLTPRSVSPRRPFSRQARSPQVRTRSFSAQSPDLRRVSLDHKSFAVHCPLALLGSAFYPVLVHRLAVSLHASSPHSVALMQLRFASFAVANLREDFHLQDRTHAGRTIKKRGRTPAFKTPITFALTAGCCANTCG
jgi:hypothetical protein